MKILIIGQAPPNQDQVVPYDTTMLYEWFDEIGISKDQAQNLFDFDAVYNKFPGYNDNGKGHKVPTQEQMEQYYEESLKYKVEAANKIIILGKSAAEFLASKSIKASILHLMHPSRMNYNRYMKNKNDIINSLKKFIS